MNEWDKNRSNQMFKNKITAAKSTLGKSLVFIKISFYFKPEF